MVGYPFIFNSFSTCTQILKTVEMMQVLPFFPFHFSHGSVYWLPRKLLLPGTEAAVLSLSWAEISVVAYQLSSSVGGEPVLSHLAPGSLISQEQLYIVLLVFWQEERSKGYHNSNWGAKTEQGSLEVGSQILQVKRPQSIKGDASQHTQMLRADKDGCTTHRSDLEGNQERGGKFNCYVSAAVLCISYLFCIHFISLLPSTPFLTIIQRHTHSSSHTQLLFQFWVTQVTWSSQRLNNILQFTQLLSNEAGNESQPNPMKIHTRVPPSLGYVST